MKHRCNWPKDNPLMIAYHDEEWGVPVHDDQKHFEFLVLDAFQAGLSWKTVLYKREALRRAFAGFDVARVARMSEAQLEKLLEDPSIIRNRLKIYATVKNAKAFLEIQKEFGSFDRYIWSFVDYTTIVNRRKRTDPIPSTSKESDAMSKALKKRGFTFVGSTICYAYMQAAGLVNDHMIECFRYKELT
jgi:DNA-3-methyladenine glycosylase I